MKAWILAVKIFNYARDIISSTLSKFGVTRISVSLAFYQGSYTVREYHKDYEV